MTPPVDAIKYPPLHNVLECLPQKKLPNLSKVADADLDFNLATTADKQTVGGVSKIRCICSSSPFMSVTLHLISFAKSCIIGNRNCRISGVRI